MEDFNNGVNDIIPPIGLQITSDPAIAALSTWAIVVAFILVILILIFVSIKIFRKSKKK